MVLPETWNKYVPECSLCPIHDESILCGGYSRLVPPIIGVCSLCGLQMKGMSDFSMCFVFVSFVKFVTVSNDGWHQRWHDKIKASSCWRALKNRFWYFLSVYVLKLVSHGVGWGRVLRFERDSARHVLFFCVFFRQPWSSVEIK